LKEEFHLSVVVTTRNDNHGKNLTYRMQQFVNGFVEQCKRYNLKAELIFVEWNPPEDRPPLSEALDFPSEKGPCAIRIIRVPKEVHMQFEHSDRIPLFQMIGKNVGIRRAQGKFILATNIDILFSNELFQFLRQDLKPGTLYRVDRLDVPEKLPEFDSFDEILKFCSKSFFRIHGKFGSTTRRKKSLMRFCEAQLRKIGLMIPAFFHKSLMELFQNFFTIISTFCKGIFRIIKLILHTPLYKFVMCPCRVIKKIAGRCLSILCPKRFHPLHTNACGDFTLLSTEDWERLKGYPEWHCFSWHLDSVLLFQAKNHGIKEVDLPRKWPIYHIDHEIGSGFTPEGQNQLFERLNTKGIPYLSNADLVKVIKELKTRDRGVVYNQVNWGLSHLTLEEFWV